MDQGPPKLIVLMLMILFSAAGAAFPQSPKPLEFEAAQKHWLARDQDNRKVVGGVAASEADHKWQVGLLRSSIPDDYYALYCSGSLVGPNIVLSAAHCLLNLEPSEISVLVGASKLDGSGVRVGVEKIELNPAYDINKLDADIARVTLKEDVTAPAIRVASEADETREFKANNSLSVSGWGVFDTQLDQKSSQLLETSVPFQPRKLCNSAESYDNMITPNMFCAGYLAGGSDACTFDSGGPITVGTGKKRKLIGIVSFGEDCGKPKKFGVYTRVVPFRNWALAQTAAK